MEKIKNIMAEKIKYIAIAMVAMMVIGTAGVFATNAYAQTATEEAVVECNEDNVLGHGGSADHPPECEDVVVEEDTMVPLPVVPANVVDMLDGWVLVAEDDDIQCIKAGAEGQTRAEAHTNSYDNEDSVDSNGKLNENAAKKKDPISVSGEGCVRISVKVEVRGSATVE